MSDLCRKLKETAAALAIAAALGTPAALAAGMGGMTGMGGPGASPHIDTAEKARLVAQTWLEVVGAKGFAIGTIHEVKQIYVVAIVPEDSPQKIRDQLIIRKADGYTFPVFPLGPPGPNVELGTGGMSGMDG